MEEEDDAFEQRRLNLWQELRYLHSMIVGGKCEHKGASVENVLWEVQSEWPARVLSHFHI